MSLRGGPLWADVAISFKSFADSPKNIENRKILPQILIEIPTVASLPRNDMLFCYCSAKQQFTLPTPGRKKAAAYAVAFADCRKMSL